MRFFFSLLVALILLTPARAAQNLKDVQANAYFRVRDRNPPLTRFDPSALLADPERFLGKLVEWRGTVTKIDDQEALTTMEVARGSAGPAAQIRFPLDEHLIDWPCIEEKEEVRALCRIVQNEDGTSALELVIAVNEREAAIVDQLRALSLTAKRTPQGRRVITSGQYVALYAAAIRNFNRGVSPSEAREIAANIINQSRKNGIDARLVMAVIAQESRFNTKATSYVGAQGLGQLMPGTAKDLGVLDAYNMQENLRGSVTLLRRHMQQMSRRGGLHQDTIKLALACYNAGPGAVRKYGGVPPYRETQDYVVKITRLYWSMLQPHERANLAKQGWKVQ